MASYNFPGSHKRTRKPHDGNVNNHPTTRDSVANKQHDLELEQKCKEHIMSLRLSAEEEMLDVESFNGVDWLKEEAPWPPDVQRRVYRYMHEKNLYKVSNLDDPAFVELVDLVKFQAGVPNTRNWEQKVPDKCRGLINTSTRTWKRDGLLITSNNSTRKTEVFQYLWDCAIQAAQVSYLAAQSIDGTFPRGESGDKTSLVGVDSMTGAGWSPDGSHSEKRGAESMQQSPLPSSAKRQRVEQSNLRKDSEGDSINVDCEVFSVTSPERDLADKNIRNMAAVSAAASSGNCHHTEGNIPARLSNGFESTIMTAREALSALNPAEEGRGSLHEGIQLSQKKMSSDFATEPTGDLAPARCYPIHENYRTKATSWSPSHSSPIPSSQHEGTIDGLDQAASLKPMAGPNTSQSDTSSRVYLLPVSQTTNRNIMNTSLNPVGNNGHTISSSKPHEAENNLQNSNSISQIVNSSLDNAPETSQTETRYYSLTAQTAAQVSQALSPPNHQPPSAYRVQSGPSDQSGEGITSVGDSDVTSENSYSENSESSNHSERVAHAPHAAANPQNSSQNGSDSRLSFERRFSQSLITTETTAQQPPPSITTEQDRDTQSTRLGPPGLPLPPGLPPISPQRSSDLPPPPHTSSQITWLNGPPPPPPRHAPNPNQSPPHPPVSRQNAWRNGAPPPPFQRTSDQNQGQPPPLSLPPPPMFQNAWRNSPPPPPRLAFNQNQGLPGPPQISPQGSSPPPPPLAPHQNAWPNEPPPPIQLAFNQSQGPLGAPPISPQDQRSSAPPPPPPPICQDSWPNGPPPPPPSTIPQYQRPPGTPPVQCQNPPPPPAQGPPSPSAASTQYQSPYPANASNSVAGPPPHQFQSLIQQQPSSSPWYSAQYIGQPPPAATQNQPVGPPFAESGSVPRKTSPISTFFTAGLKSGTVWEKYDEMVFIHIPTSMPTDANLIRQVTTRIFRARDVLKQTVVEIFQWISGLLNTALPSKLVFDFIDVRSNLERRMILYQGDSKVLETVRNIAWGLFIEIGSLDPAVANVKILILPLFSAAFGSRHESMQQQSQQLHCANAASAIPSDQPSSLLLPNQNGSSIASDSARRPSITQSGGLAPFGPHPQSQSSFFGSPAPNTINSRGGPPNLAPISMPIPHKKPTPERNVPDSNNDIVEADVPSYPDPQRQSQQQPAQVPAPNSTKTENSHSTAKIVIRIQIDGHGRLSPRYDRSTLSTRITSTRFFAWFAQETGHTCSGKLRFDFKDALPAKSSVIEAGNDDHFELMVCDIKRKFERAKNFAPDLNEFCIVVTDPLWDSGDEGDDE